MISIFLSVIIFLLSGGLTTAAQDAVPVITAVNVGVNGIYKNGLWTPVVVDWNVPEKNTLVSHITLLSVDSDGVPIEYRFDTAEIKVRGSLECYVKLGRQNEPLKISLQDKNSTTLAEKIYFPNVLHPVPCERPVYLIIGKEDIGLQSAVAELSLREDRRPLLSKVQSVKDLPTQWFGYEAVDTVVITTTEPEQFKGLTADSPQIKALEQWLKLGGRILFCAGKNAGQLLEKENSPLRPFLPGKFERMTEMWKSSVLETFCESKRQIFMNGTDEAPYLKMPHFTEPKGIVLLKDLDLPLVSRCAYGFGLIIYFGGDLSGRPLSVWKDRTTLVRNIMQWNTEKQTAVRSNGSLLQLGYTDISGQIRSALDKFDGVRVVPFSVILIILAVYFLVIGPADWYLVHKVLKKPVLTWFTFPMWIVLFAVLAYCLGGNNFFAHRPHKVIMNELTLLDTDTETGIIRCTTWAGLYSPKDKLYDLTAVPIDYFPFYKNETEWIKEKTGRQQEPDTLLSWNGLTGSGLGGMSPKTISPNVWTAKAVQPFYYNHTEKQNSGIDTECLSSDYIGGVPVQIRSTKSFFAQSWKFQTALKSPELNREIILPQLDSKLADEEGIPVGTLALAKDLLPLENVILVYGRWVLELGNIESGAAVEVGKKTKRRELRDLLIQPEVLEDSRLQQFSGYNMQSTDLNYIAKVFSFYGILGGFDSTGLHHSYQHNLDMSGLFSADRAVLLGSMRQKHNDTAFADVLSGTIGLYNKEFEPVKLNRMTIFRQVLPIKLTELSPRLGHSNTGISNKDDALADPDKTIEGVGTYDDPSKNSKGNNPKK